MKLVSENVGGNLHAAVEYINRAGLADYVLHMDCVSGANTVIVYRVPVRHPLALAQAERHTRHLAEQGKRAHAERMREVLR